VTGINRPLHETYADDLDRRIGGLPVSPLLRDTLYTAIRRLSPENQMRAIEQVEGQLIDAMMDAAFRD
jgi:hypothetical protein